jgi:hypothetical protein
VKTKKSKEITIIEIYSCLNKVCQVTCAGQWLTLATPVSFTNKTDPHDILLKVTFNTIKPTNYQTTTTHLK